MGGTEMSARIVARRVLATICVIVLAGCGSTPNSAQITAGVEEPEPTSTFVKDVEPTPLFELLTITADFPQYGSAAEQMATIDADAVVLGEVQSVTVDPNDSDEPVSGTLNGAWLTVRPSMVAGSVPMQTDGSVIIEMFRPALVTGPWLDQATDFDGVTLFIVKDIGTSQVATVTDGMGVYRFGSEGVAAPAVGGQAPPSDLRLPSLEAVFEELATYVE